MNFEKVKKISLIGGPSTGKSTLAENMGRDLKLPIIHMDGLNYEPGWIEIDKNKRDTIIREKIAEPEWIMEGTYRSTLKERLEKSDLIIFLDYSTMSKVVGIIKRTFDYKGKERKEIPGCNEKMDWKFFKFTLNWNRKKRKEILGMVEQAGGDKALIFKNRKKLNRWYQENFKNSIDSNILKKI